MTGLDMFAKDTRDLGPDATAGGHALDLGAQRRTLPRLLRKLPILFSRHCGALITACGRSRNKIRGARHLFGASCATSA